MAIVVSPFLPLRNLIGHVLLKSRATPKQKITNQIEGAPTEVLGME